MSFEKILRPNIISLDPYRCARDDFSEGILLDANENTHGPAVHDLTAEESQLDLNRYPDPHQIELKQLICDFRGNGLKPENLYLGVGSDEVIDMLIRAVCRPGSHKILICPPTYGMYSVSAKINDVAVEKIMLDLETFDLRPEAVLEKLHQDTSIKLVYICSPGNPTGKRVDESAILKIAEGWDNGLVVVDEAYIDFTENMPSLAGGVNHHSRIVVAQTLSKSFGLAGIRLGICYADKNLARVLNAMKAPYNISSNTAALAKRALSPESLARMKEAVAKIREERSNLIHELKNIKGIGRNRGGQDANFVLVEVLDKNGNPSNERALQTYNLLARDRKIVVRFRGTEPGCLGCLRISVGTREENSILIKELIDILENH